jgi:Gpi18-like mannosyltransferase
MKQLFNHPIIKLFLIWRVWILIPLVLASLYIPFRENSLFTTLWQYTPKYSVIENPLIYPWSNFDGVHYIAIASRGYINEGRFLPLFPLLIQIVTYPIQFFSKLQPYGATTFWTGLFLSNLFFLLALGSLYKLLRLDYKKETVIKTILLLIVFPTSFFFVSVYTESLFLLLSVLALLSARKKQWGRAILLSMLLTITRLPGILIVIPLFYEYLTQEIKIKKIKEIKKIFTLKNLLKLSPFLLIPLPLLGYSYFNYLKWNDPLFFIHAHDLGNSRSVSGLVFPLITIYRYLKIFLTVSIKQYEFWVAIIEFISLILAMIGIFFAFIKKLKPSYQLFSIALISLPLLSGTLTGFPRYLILAFPLFLAATLKLENNKKIFNLLLLLSIFLQSILLMIFARGWYIS